MKQATMGEQPGKRRLFQKFINKQCTTEEVEEVLAYIRADQIPPEFEAVMRENLEQKIAANPKVAPEVSSRLFRDIQTKISSGERKGKVRRLWMGRRMTAVAAAVGLLLLTGLAYFHLPVWNDSAQIYSTNYGETEHIMLPDGSTMVLNANSRLTVPSDWQALLGGDKDFVREVWLEGEAFFEVKRLSRPTRFVVHTGDLKVEVLGTRFDVNSREEKTRVVLDEGKVKLLARDQPELIMQPGDLVELSKDDAQFRKRIVNPDAYIAWRNNELIFEATPVTEITDMLKHNYGYEITIRNPQVNQNMLFTGEVPANDVPLLLRMLSESFDVKILQEDKKIVFQ